MYTSMIPLVGPGEILVVGVIAAGMFVFALLSRFAMGFIFNTP